MMTERPTWLQIEVATYLTTTPTRQGDDADADADAADDDDDNEADDAGGVDDTDDQWASPWLDRAASVETRRACPGRAPPHHSPPSPPEASRALNSPETHARERYSCRRHITQTPPRVAAARHTIQTQEHICATLSGIDPNPNTGALMCGVNTDGPTATEPSLSKTAPAASQ